MASQLHEQIRVPSDAVPHLIDIKVSPVTNPYVVAEIRIRVGEIDDDGEVSMWIDDYEDYLSKQDSCAGLAKTCVDWIDSEVGFDSSTDRGTVQTRIETMLRQASSGTLTPR